MLGVKPQAGHNPPHASIERGSKSPNALCAVALYELAPMHRTMQSSEMPPLSPADGDGLCVAMRMGNVHKGKIFVDETGIHSCTEIQGWFCETSVVHACLVN